MISSYIFYGWWDWRFLSLIFASTYVDYFTGHYIFNSSSRKDKRKYLGISIVFNLGLLGLFKYFNFFIDSWVSLLNTFGYELNNLWSLNIILPVGISFYTFQTMSYSLDIFYKKIEPTKDFISFASFVSFFPQLVAGPIERASNLLPQMLNKRKFDYYDSVIGLRLMRWGMFKKVAIADSLSPTVDYIFQNYTNLDGGVLALGLIYFSFQIYCDFSGYSDIAIGTAKLFGFKLSSNFKFPYFSRNIGEFWKRWHISLSSWFRDYLYIPMGGSKGSMAQNIKNIFIIFIISGFWHGASWNFIIWGSFHSILFLPIFIYGTNKKYGVDVIAKDSFLPTFIDLIKVLATYISTTIAWVFFRSDSIYDSFLYLALMLKNLSIPNTSRFGLLYVLIIVLFDWNFRQNEQNPLSFKSKITRYTVYYILLIMIVLNIHSGEQFIYFQF